MHSIILATTEEQGTPEEAATATAVAAMVDLRDQTAKMELPTLTHVLVATKASVELGRH